MLLILSLKGNCVPLEMFKRCELFVQYLAHQKIRKRPLCNVCGNKFKHKAHTDIMQNVLCKRNPQNLKMSVLSWKRLIYVNILQALDLVSNWLNFKVRCLDWNSIFQKWKKNPPLQYEDIINFHWTKNEVIWFDILSHFRTFLTPKKS